METNKDTKNSQILTVKKISSLESYFKTENEHWNGFTFEMVCEVLQESQFENPELPLKLFSIGETIFVENPDTPVKALQKFSGELDKHNLSTSQKIFVFKWVYKYLNKTEYENLDLTTAKELLKSQTEKLQAENQTVKPLTKDIRDILKDMMLKEIENLPETMKGLEPMQRLNILCKLFPFVLPKVVSVNHELGEPNEYKMKTWY